MSSSSNPRDHRGRYVPGSSARPHSSRSSSHSHNNSRPSQPYVTSSSNHNHNHTTDDWENPEYAEGYYRRQFMERRSQNNDYYQDPPPRPSAPPMEEDEVLARRLQHEMNSDFLQDRNVVVVPPTSRYVITPVDNEMEVPYQQQRQQYQSSSRAAEPDGYSYSTSNRRKNPPQDNNYRYSTSTAAAAVARGTNNVGMSSSSSYPKKSSRRDMMIADLDEEEDLRLAQQLQDEELARQLEQEEAEARRKAARQQQQQQQKKARASTRSTTATTTSFSDSSSEEQAAARRVAQEMEDAEIAQRLSLYEQEVAANQVQESQANNRSHLIWHRLLPLLCCAVAIIVSLLFVLNVFDGEKVRNGINDWVDPFKGDVAINGSPAPGGPTGIAADQMAWKTNGQGGLNLEILNAMDDRWTQPLSVAVQNWDDGYPIDSLTLRVTRVSIDPTCTEETGKLKICNADYGNTRWRGLNNLLLNRQTQEIVSSSAKMNEFYLEQESNDQKLYTLCHELGHGFGLPHWDEDFFNRDMGNCMDYTLNPGTNKRPDVTNFNFLSQLYGGRNITSGEFITAADAVAAAGDSNVFNENSVTATEAHVEGDQDDKNNNKNDRRKRRVLRKLLRSSSTLPSQVIFTDNNKDDRVPSHRRRILHASKHFEVHRILSEDESEDGDYIRLQFYLMV